MRLYEVAVPQPGEKLTIDTGLEAYQHQLDDAHSRKKHLMQLLHSQADLQSSTDLMPEIDAVDREIADLKTKITDLQANYKNISHIQKLWDNVESACSQSISEMQKAGALLYRGLKNNTNPAFHGHSLINRRPKDSLKMLSTIFDYALIELGAKALRSNSIFVSADYFQTSGYGNPYIIFPIDGRYDITWTNEKDMVLDIEDLDMFIDSRKLLNLRKQITGVIKDLAEKIAQDPKIDHDDLTKLDQLIRLGKDEFIFTLFDIDIEYFKNHYNLDLDWHHYVDIENIKTRYEPKFSDLSEAIRSWKEIYIHGQYYALNSTFFLNFVCNELNIPLPKTGYRF